MLKRIIASLLLATYALLPLNAYAEEAPALPTIIAPAGEKDAGLTISPLKKDNKAPFTGVLLSPAAVASIIAQAHVYDAQVKLEVDKTKAEEQAQCQYRVSEIKTTTDADKGILQARYDAKVKEVEALQKQIKPSTSTAPALYVSGGAVAGIGLTLLTVFVVSRVTK